MKPFLPFVFIFYGLSFLNRLGCGAVPALLSWRCENTSFFTFWEFFFWGATFARACPCFRAVNSPPWIAKQKKKNRGFQLSVEHVTFVFFLLWTKQIFLFLLHNFDQVFTKKTNHHVSHPNTGRAADSVHLSQPDVYPTSEPISSVRWCEPKKKSTTHPTEKLAPGKRASGITFTSARIGATLFFPQYL